MLRKQNRLQEGQTCFSILPEQPFPGVLSSHPVQALCQWMSTSLVGNDTNILSSLPSGAQFHFNMSAGLITQGHRNIIFSPSLTVHEHVLLFPSKANTKTMDTHTHTPLSFAKSFFFFRLCIHMTYIWKITYNSKLSCENILVKMMVSEKKTNMFLFSTQSCNCQRHTDPNNNKFLSVIGAVVIG